MFSFGGRRPISGDMPLPDTSETVYISSLALLKMLKHGRAGVPVEVMGLMLGEYVDDYTVRVVDVFAMPQNGTGVSVEAVDEVYQTTMIEMLRQTGRKESIVGWYHSHPGFGCWLSSIDISTQQSFEKLNERCVAVVVDPIQSVKGKVVIDAFRTIQNQFSLGVEPRQVTSNQGHLTKPTSQAKVRGLGKQYYSMPIEFSKNEVDERMLLNLQKKKWTDSLEVESSQRKDSNIQTIDKLIGLVKQYNQNIQDEALDPKLRDLQQVGKIDPKKHLQRIADQALTENAVDTLGVFMNTVVF
ncbi:26S proteasome non-ATPase regulatory subunit 14, putative [Entamoeba histolytica HM-1:IMSS-B]|uniref:26S proteasome non-ATPase regulatory subunit 14, putative n=7 Tax=Entamoeba histolytica TaxID=5759 RepID=C4M1W8_ENTH1|nr:26S proteasome non-ATPase regulatory subunit 14, putative [Entamoeba histolytica HM-1:IMSS]EMD43342.1 26S proteasome nonATPase regulatory subunit 14, putative [Entamoeba histolytica KU27]EMH74899.1 26S proteasome non-ATPase regulatory subunit 14, putative [Entamoeba histolytica HM-1:IMSS-B]EMS10844.1 26S proteasome non-ATPase regulatory subunit 14, putative [Entamoeba histolytica HM-3:IMSS]ENY62230.1 26S proteasome non-ATPase regulatory subunit 14, putative [Entamoeba histolytica HM-1:IMSS-A|eukprot:XP_650487.2 26S proteasome non-ATPase regulatory subunit 14, putative [Entamoeba histolytica HM-1:IMSS]